MPADRLKMDLITVGEMESLLEVVDATPAGDHSEEAGCLPQSWCCNRLAALLFHFRADLIAAARAHLDPETSNADA